LFRLIDGCSLFTLIAAVNQVVMSFFAENRSIMMVWVASSRPHKWKLLTNRWFATPESVMVEGPQSFDALRRRVARLFAIVSLNALVIMGALTVGARCPQFDHRHR
jgi:hypothetical protein